MLANYNTAVFVYIDTMKTTFLLVCTGIFTCTIGLYWDIYLYYWFVLGYLPVLSVCTGIFTCIIGVYWDIYLYYRCVLGYLPVLLVCTGISSTLVGISLYYLRHSNKITIIIIKHSLELQAKDLNDPLKLVKTNPTWCTSTK